MQRSTSHILTTHTGSLPRSPELQELLRFREERCSYDANTFAAGVRTAVQEVVQKQVAIGLDVINDFFPSEMVTDRFDVIVFYTVLEHLHNTGDFLDNVKKQLAPDGKLFLSVPGKSFHSEFYGQFRKKGSQYPYR